MTEDEENDFIEIINRGLLSTIPLGFWQIEI